MMFQHKSRTKAIASLAGLFFPARFAMPDDTDIFEPGTSEFEVRADFTVLPQPAVIGDDDPIVVECLTTIQSAYRRFKAGQWESATPPDTGLDGPAVAPIYKRFR
jgi:hypothetical protein